MRIKTRLSYGKSIVRHNEKVVFLDRDGVINKKAREHDYIKSWREFEFLPEAITALKLLIEKGYDIFIITNQRGIARKLMTLGTVNNIHHLMQVELAKHNVSITDIYVCPHDYADDCTCRKPKPGMIFRAAKDHGIELGNSICIGDSDSDIIAGTNAGCTSYLVSKKMSFLQITQQL